MTESRKYRVPEEGLKAARDAWMLCADYPCDPSRFRQTIEPVLEAFIRWQSEHPQLPTPEQAGELLRFGNGVTGGYGQTDAWLAKVAAIGTEWVRRMYEVPKPDHTRKAAHEFYAAWDKAKAQSNYDKEAWINASNALESAIRTIRKANGEAPDGE